MKSPKSKSNDLAMAQTFKGDPAYAAHYLNTLLHDGDQAELMCAMRQMAIAAGGVKYVAEQTQLSHTQLYKTLSVDGNPVLSSLRDILKSMGFGLSIQPLTQATASA